MRSSESCVNGIMSEDSFFSVDHFGGKSSEYDTPRLHGLLLHLSLCVCLACRCGRPGFSAAFCFPAEMGMALSRLLFKTALLARILFLFTSIRFNLVLRETT